jgi:hypothetical protein
MSCAPYFFFLGLYLHLFLFDVEAEVVVDTHVLIGDPNEGEQGDQVSTPVNVQKFEAGYDQEKCGDVVAEAIFAGE